MRRFANGNIYKRKHGVNGFLCMYNCLLMYPRDQRWNICDTCRNTLHLVNEILFEKCCMFRLKAHFRICTFHTKYLPITHYPHILDGCSLIYFWYTLTYVYNGCAMCVQTVQLRMPCYIYTHTSYIHLSKTLPSNVTRM